MTAGHNTGREDESGLSPTSEKLLVVLLIFFSLALGLLAVYQYRNYPAFENPILDEESYVSWAFDIASGDVLGDKVFYQDPLYPYFLSLVFTIFGESLALVRVAQVILGSLSVLFVYLMSRKILGVKGAFISGIVIALYPGLYFYELVLVKANLVLFLSALSCMLGVYAAHKRSLLLFAGTGATLGLLGLLRGNFQLLFPFIILWAALAVPEEALKRRIAKGLVVAGGILLMLMPVAIRNYSVGGELVLTTSQGGANFYIGNNEMADGLYKVLPFVRPEPRWEAHDFKVEAEQRTGSDMSYSEVSRYWFGEGVEWILENPGEAFNLWMHKARLMVHNHEVPDNHSLRQVRKYFVPVLSIPFLGIGILWGPALIGLVALVRRDRRSWYPAVFALLYAGSIIPFFIVSRYRVAIVPAMALFVSAFVLWVIAKVNEKDRIRLGIAGAFLVFALLVGLLPIRESTWPQPFAMYNIGNAYFDTGRFEEAVKWYDMALRHLPDNDDIIANRERALHLLETGKGDDLSRLVPGVRPDPKELAAFAKMLEQEGKLMEAAELYKKAAAFYPDAVWPRAGLGALYIRHDSIRDPEKALTHFMAAHQLDPENADITSAIAACYAIMEDYGRAKEWWKTSIKIDPDHKSALEGLEQLKKMEPEEDPDGEKD